MKELNLKKMASEMSFHDKATIIFADWNLRRDTNEKERLISVQEEEAIVNDIRKNKQIGQLNLLTELYNMSNMLALDIQGQTLGLKLAMANVNWFVLAIHLNGQTEDRTEEFLSMIAAKEKKDFEKKLKKNKFDDFLSIMHPGDDVENLSARQPNLQLQDFLETLVCNTKALRKTMRMMDYIQDKAGIDFFSKEAKKLIHEAQDELKHVEDLDGFLNVLTVYKKYLELGLMRKNNFHAPCFLQLIQDHKGALQLLDEENREADEQIAGYIAKRN